METQETNSALNLLSWKVVDISGTGGRTRGISFEARSLETSDKD